MSSHIQDCVLLLLRYATAALTLVATVGASFSRDHRKRPTENASETRNRHQSEHLTRSTRPFARLLCHIQNFNVARAAAAVLTAIGKACRACPS